MLNPSIFKPYDIRGIYPDEFDEKGAERIAQALLLFLNQKYKKVDTLIVAYDMRSSSGPLRNALVEVFQRSGIHVIDIGQSTTPMYYFALNRFKADGGVMVTASHNPAKFNGFKLNESGARSLAQGMGMEELSAMALGSQNAPEKKGGIIELIDISEAYLDFLFFLVAPDSIGSMKIAVDAGNGMTGIFLPKLFSRLPQLEVIPLYFEPDGTFPHHEANPIKKETLADLKQTVLSQKADLGVAFDGDGDRIGFVTEKGQDVGGDIIAAVLAQEIAKANPGSTILYEARASRIVPEIIEKNGAKAIPTIHGHAFINQNMIKHDALFCGELSGHYFYKEFFFRESAILTMLKILAIFTKKGGVFSELLKPFQKYVQSGEINFEIEDKKGALERLEKAFPEAKIEKIDGLSVIFDDWWFNIVPSRTEDLLRLNIEANTPALITEKRKILENIIRG